MKKNWSKVLCFLLSLSLLTCFIPASADNESESEMVNYAMGENASYAYITDDTAASWYGSLADDLCELLNDGNIPYRETPFESVGVQGSNRLVTVVFDLGAIYPDIKTIKFCGVWDCFNHGSAGKNRSFSGERTLIEFSEDGVNYKRSKDFEMTKENWSEDGSENGFYNFVFTFNSNVKAKTVRLSFWSPTYVMSLGEIQIWGSGSSPVPPTIKYEDSGTEENGIKWQYSEGGKMVFSGEGDVPPSASSSWGKYKSFIKDLYLGDGITSIETFESQQKLEYVSLGKAFNSSMNFKECTYLKEVVINSEIEKIDARCFEYCSYLEKVTFNGNVVNIGDYAFYYCFRLAEITLPEGLESIGEGAFSRCGNFAEITLPESLKSIGEGAFANFDSLKKVTFNGNVVNIGNYAFYNCDSLAEITLPEGLESISEGAFADCDSLAEITLPEGLKSIGKGAFASCDSLESIYIPKTVESFGEYSINTRILLGGKGTAAHEYAIEHGIPFIDVDEYNVNIDNDKNITINVGEKTTAQDIINSLGSVSLNDKNNNAFSSTLDYVSTGSKVQYANGCVVTIVIKGDVDGSGVIDSTDYLSIKKKFLGEFEIEGIYAQAADRNSDGFINSTDYLAIKKHFLSLE